MILSADFLGDVTEPEAEVFHLWEWGHEVEIGDVHGHELGPFGGDDTVDQKFGFEHFGCGGWPLCQGS